MKVIAYECPDAPPSLRYLVKGVCTTDAERSFTRRVMKPICEGDFMLLPTFAFRATRDECETALDRYAAEIAEAAAKARRRRRRPKAKADQAPQDAGDYIEDCV